MVSEWLEVGSGWSVGGQWVVKVGQWWSEWSVMATGGNRVASECLVVINGWSVIVSSKSAAGDGQ